MDKLSEGTNEENLSFLSEVLTPTLYDRLAVQLEFLHAQHKIWPQFKLLRMYDAHVRDIWLRFGQKSQYLNPESLLPSHNPETSTVMQLANIELCESISKDETPYYSAKQQVQQGIRIKVDVDLDAEIWVGLKKEGDQQEVLDSRQQRQLIQVSFISPWFEPSEKLIRLWGKDMEPAGWNWRMADMDQWLEEKEWLEAKSAS